MAISTALFSVAVTLRQQGASFVLRFTDLARAMECYEKLKSVEFPSATGLFVVPCRDDFGTNVSVDRRDILIALVEDFAKALEVNGTVELMKARANIWLQEAGGKDALLNGKLVMPSGPGPVNGRPSRQ